MQIKSIKKNLYILFSTLFMLTFAQAALAKINIVAAENFYGDIAQTVGGEHVTVTSILNSPQQDPHLFSATPSVAKNIAHADIVIYNGGHYSEWMPRLLSVPGQKANRQIIVVADLVDINANENPHIWYDPDTIWLYAQKLTAILIALDPDHKADYLKQLSLLEKQQTSFKAYIAEIKPKLNGQPFAATEPVFDYMADALGLSMQAKAFQWSVENDGSPTPSAMKQMLEVIEQKKIKALLYNQQVSDPMIANLIKMAQKNNIPIVAVTETQPEGLGYYDWMRKQLEALVGVI